MPSCHAAPSDQVPQAMYLYNSTRPAGVGKTGNAPEQSTVPCRYYLDVPYLL